MFFKVVLLTTLLVAIDAKPSTTLIMMGGYERGEGKTQIYEEIIYRAGGYKHLKLCFITVAAENPETDKVKYMGDFEEMGVPAKKMFWLNVNKDDFTVANDPKMVKIAKKCTGYFFGGGDQDRIVAALLTQDRMSTRVLKVIQKRFKKAKAIVAGTSGGAECQTSLGMLIAGNSYEGMKYGSKPIGSEDIQANDLTYDAEGGLSNVDFVVDVHFSQKGRHGRLMRLMADFWGQKKFLSVGIDENTALILEHNVKWDSMHGSVLGEGSVYFFNFDEAIINQTSKYFQVEGIKSSNLRNGDCFDIEHYAACEKFHMEVTFDECERECLGGKGNLSEPLTSNDIFKHKVSDDELGEYEKVVASLVDTHNHTTTYGLSKETSPQFKLDFIAKCSNGFQAFGKLKDNEMTDISYDNLIINISAQE